MSLKSRVNRVENLEDYRQRRTRRTGSETATDAELEAIVADALGIDESEITDKLLEAIVRGDV